MKNFIAVSLFCSLICSSIMAETLMNPTSLSKDLYSVEILDGNYLSDINKPSNFLNFNYGERVASPAQISAAIIAWSKQSERLKVVEYAQSHEGRPLYALFIHPLHTSHFAPPHATYEATTPLSGTPVSHRIGLKRL